MSAECESLSFRFASANENDSQQLPQHRSAKTKCKSGGLAASADYTTDAQDLSSTIYNLLPPARK